MSQNPSIDSHYIHRKSRSQVRDLEFAKSRRSRPHENIRQANSDSDVEIGWYSLLSLKDIPDSLGSFSRREVQPYWGSWWMNITSSC